MRTTCRGGIFPPVVVYDDGTDKWLSEGFHRLYAARQMGMPEIAAEVRQGTKRDAQLNSMRSNATHGARRSNADKRRAVEMAFRYLIEGGRTAQGVTNVEVAEMANVNEKTVRRLREEIMPETDTTSAKPKAPEITISAPPDLTVTARLKDQLAAAERRIAELEARRPETVEVERVVVEVPPEVQQELDMLSRRLDEAHRRLENANSEIAKARAERRDVDSLLTRKAEIQEALNELTKKKDDRETYLKYAVELSTSLREVHKVLESKKGAFERLAKTGMPDNWDARYVCTVRDLCYEWGEMLDMSVDTVSLWGGLKGEQSDGSDDV